jgi:hypothetical protein
MGLGGEKGRGRPRKMNAKSERAHDWQNFLWRMAHQFEELLGSKPLCMEDVVHELRKHDEWILPWESITRLAPANEDAQDVLPRAMQRCGYYASLQGSWLVCSKNKKQHDAMLFAAQASQVVAEANTMVVPARRSDDEIGHRQHAA